jgi:NADPH2:quinone reductase
MLQSLQGTEAMVIRLCSDGMAEALGRRWRVRAGSRQVPVRGLLVELELTLGILAPFGTLISYGAVTGSVEGLDTAKLGPLLYDPAPSQILTGFNLGIWFEHRIEVAIASLQKLVGWIATGELRTPAVHLLPLADAAEAHRLLESGVTTGKVVLKP